MDFLAGSGLEPQLAIPVLFVVVGAVLVYLFGFQKTEEPSYEHLAVLQSSSSYKNRSVSSNAKQTKGSSGAGSVTKVKANGHVVTDKERNGVVKKVAKVETKDKENKPPQVKAQVKKQEKAKAAANKPEDFESGDWIQAPSKKDKKKTTKKAEPAYGSSSVPSSPVKSHREPEPGEIILGKLTKETAENWDIKVLQEVESIQNKQNHSTQTSPEKKDKKVAVQTSSSESSTPKKTAPAVSIVDVNPIVVEDKQSENVTPVVAGRQSESEKDVKGGKTNIAFDEMGDSWEEAKSRGAKKRRTRKD